MATDREALVDVFTRVRIALTHPDISSNERAILEMEYISAYDEEDVRDSLCMTQREYRKTKSDALDKASIMPKPAKKVAIEPKPEQMEAG